MNLAIGLDPLMSHHLNYYFSYDVCPSVWVSVFLQKKIFVQNGSNSQIRWTDISNSRIQARRAWRLVSNKALLENGSLSSRPFWNPQIYEFLFNPGSDPLLLAYGWDHFTLTLFLGYLHTRPIARDQRSKLNFIYKSWEIFTLLLTGTTFIGQK